MEIGSGIGAQENRGLFQTIHKGKMNKDTEKSQGNRKIFQTLQCSAQDPQKLAGQVPVSKKPISKLVPSKEPLSKHVYKDPKIVKTFDHKAVQTERGKRLGSQSSLSEDIDQEAYDLMVSEEVPESYWKELAEQRRIALNDSLHENEMLHKEVEDLREENSKLSEMAEKADYFADVIQTMLGEKKNRRKVKNLMKNKKIRKWMKSRHHLVKKMIPPLQAKNNVLQNLMIQKHQQHKQRNDFEGVQNSYDVKYFTTLCEAPASCAGRRQRKLMGVVFNFQSVIAIGCVVGFWNTD